MEGGATSEAILTASWSALDPLQLLVVQRHSHSLQEEDTDPASTCTLPTAPPIGICGVSRRLQMNLFFPR